MPDWLELSCVPSEKKECSSNCFPSGRYGHSATLVGIKNILVFGGLADGDKKYERTIWKHDAHNSLSELDLTNEMYVLKLNIRANKLLRDKNVWSRIKYESANIPAPRWKHTATKIGASEIVIYGGLSDGEKRVAFNDIWVFNCADNTWKNKEVPATKYRGSHTACGIDRQIYIIGGYGGDYPFSRSYLSDVCILDTVTWKLTQVRRKV